MRQALLVLLLLCTAGTASAQSLDDIRRRGHLLVASTCANAPFSFVNERNECTGLDMDYARLVAAEIGVEPRWVRLDWRGILPGLLARQFDMVAAAVTVTPERAAAFAFSDPYGYDDVVIAVPIRNTTVRTWADLRGLTVATGTGSIGEQTARRYGGYRDLRTLAGHPEVMLDLVTGRADAAVVGLTATLHFMQLRNAPIRVTAEGDNVGMKALVARKEGSEELLGAANRAIARARGDGTYERLFRQWFGADPIR